MAPTWAGPGLFEKILRYFDHFFSSQFIKSKLDGCFNVDVGGCSHLGKHSEIVQINCKQR